MRITVVWATSDVQDLVTLDVPPGTTVADAVARSGLLAHYGLDPASLGYAIFGRRAFAQTRLAVDDRVELTRPLAAYPREMRQRRADIVPSANAPPPTKRRSSR
jgi:putative ubiquitin-RnfH superfamily antitoxin RatB of RatAB toxin-antitoxin module